MNPSLAMSVLTQRQFQNKPAYSKYQEPRYKPAKDINPKLEMTERTLDHSSDLLLRMEEVDEIPIASQYTA